MKTKTQTVYKVVVAMRPNSRELTSCVTFGDQRIRYPIRGWTRKLGPIENPLFVFDSLTPAKDFRRGLGGDSNPCVQVWKATGKNVRKAIMFKGTSFSGKRLSGDSFFVGTSFASAVRLYKRIV